MYSHCTVTNVCWTVGRPGQDVNILCCFLLVFQEGSQPLKLKSSMDWFSGPSRFVFAKRQIFSYLTIKYFCSSEQRVCSLDFYGELLDVCLPPLLPTFGGVQKPLICTLIQARRISAPAGGGFNMTLKSCT